MTPDDIAYLNDDRRHCKGSLAWAADIALRLISGGLHGER